MDILFLSLVRIRKSKRLDKCTDSNRQLAEKKKPWFISEETKALVDNFLLEKDP